MGFNFALKILYEDKDLLVVEKPAGLVVAREGNIREKSLIDYLIDRQPLLKKAGNSPRYGLVHRLDKEASGIILVAKNNQALDFFQKQFREREVEKKYVVLVYGVGLKREGEIESLIGRDRYNRIRQKSYHLLDPEARKRRLKKAITSWKVIREYSRYTLLSVFPKTGRKHQIRIHLKSIGYPVVGDKIYAPKINHPIKRIFLHLSQIVIKTLNGDKKVFVSDLPWELKSFLEKLK